MTAPHTEAKKTAGPWVEIDLSAVCANYAMIRRHAPRAETAAVVKCDGYGLGASAIAHSLATLENCRSFFVAYPEEGVVLRSALKDISPAPTIYVFNGPLPETMALFERARLTPVLNSLEQASKWASRKPGASAVLHIDTGMNRLGAPATELSEIAALSALQIDMVMSHLACSSDPKSRKNTAQRLEFEKLASLFPGTRRSLSASGGALMDPAYHFDLLRIGVALYGASPFDDDDDRLAPVAALKAPVVQVRHASPGETVGYGATHQVDREARFATVALGYGDGFPRSGSSRGFALVHGERVRIAGRISMDLISLDITDVQSPVKSGDIIEFFGPNLPIHDAAAAWRHHLL